MKLEKGAQPDANETRRDVMSTMKTTGPRAKSTGVAPSTAPATTTGKTKTPAPIATAHNTSSSNANATTANKYAPSVRYTQSPGLHRRAKSNVTALRSKNSMLGTSRTHADPVIPVSDSIEGQRGDDDDVAQASQTAGQQEEKQALGDTARPKTDAADKGDAVPINGLDAQSDGNAAQGAAPSPVGVSTGIVPTQSSSSSTTKSSATTSRQIPLHRRVLRASKSSISSSTSIPDTMTPSHGRDNATRPPIAVSHIKQPSRTNPLQDRSKPTTPSSSGVLRHAKSVSTDMSGAVGIGTVVGKGRSSASSTAPAASAASGAASSSSGARSTNMINTQPTSVTTPATPAQRRARALSTRASASSRPTTVTSRSGVKAHTSRGSTSSLPPLNARNTGGASTATGPSNVSTDSTSSQSIPRPRPDVSLSIRPSKMGLGAKGITSTTTAGVPRGLATRAKSSTMTPLPPKDRSQPTKATTTTSRLNLPASSSSSRTATTTATTSTPPHAQTNAVISALQTDLLQYHLLYTRHQKFLADLARDTTASLRSDFQSIADRWKRIRPAEVVRQRATNLAALAGFVDRASVAGQDGLARQVALLKDVISRVEDITADNGVYTLITYGFEIWLEDVIYSSGRWQRRDYDYNEEDSGQEPPTIIDPLPSEWLVEMQRLGPELCHLQESLACLDVPPVSPSASNPEREVDEGADADADAQSALSQVVNLHRQLMAGMRDALRTMGEVQTGVLTAQRAWIAQEIDSLLLRSSTPEHDDQEKHTEAWVPAWVS